MQKRLYWGKVDAFRKKCFCSRKSGYIPVKVVVFVQSCCISAKAVVFGQKWLYSKKSGCIREKVVVFGQSGSIWTKLMYSGKMVVVGPGGCIR